MKILDALLVLKEKAINGCIDKPYYGICYNLGVLVGRGNLSYVFVSTNCSDWDFFSGLFEYPVEISDDYDLWEGKQLELRLSLLGHLIAKAKELGV